MNNQSTFFTNRAVKRKMLGAQTQKKVTHDLCAAGGACIHTRERDNVPPPPFKTLLIKIHEDDEKAEAPLYNNTFGLEKEAETWFTKEQERSKLSYLRPGPQYTPYTSANGQILAKHLHKTCSEFYKRFANAQQRQYHQKMTQRTHLPCCSWLTV